MTEIDCKKVREEILTEAKEKLNKIHEEIGRKLKLVVIQVEGDSASDVYVRNKLRTCESVGVECDVIKLPNTISHIRLLHKILSCSLNDNVDGIILQLPLPDHLKPYQNYLLNNINGRKDVDGLTDYNVMKLWTGKDGIRPATAEAVMRLLPDDLSNDTVTVIGRSDLVGKPLIKMLMDRNATVSVCHSKTYLKDMEYLIDKSSIVISAVGKPKCLAVTPKLKYHVTYIDVGINRDENGKICGDLDIVENPNRGCHYTPVPGGVGILTTAQIVLNLIKCYELKKERNKYYELFRM